MMNKYDLYINWAKESLNCEIDCTEIIVDTPWSVVIKLQTKKSLFYLKRTPQKFSHEPDIINTLRKNFNASVPNIVKINREMNCFIMKDAGISLRTILKAHFETDMLSVPIEQYTYMQLDVMEHVELLLDIGVPDWRTNKLAERFKEKIIDNKDLLMADSASKEDLDNIEVFLPKISDLCGMLSAYEINDTIVQIDFNDNNILFDMNTGVYTLVDLGEIVISHPFFSLQNCLRQIHKHYNLNHNDTRFKCIKNALLKNYKFIYGEKRVDEAFNLVTKLWYVHDMLGQFRLFEACGRDAILGFQGGKLNKSLIDLIDTLKKH